MKKFLSILALILASLTMLSIFTIVPFNLKQKPIFTLEDVLCFSDSVSTFSKKHDDYMKIMAEDENNTNLQTNRLIVKSDETIDSKLAIDGIYGIGYQVLQYDSKTDLESEKLELLDNGYEVYEDKVLKTNDLNTTSFSGSKTEMWSYNHLDVEYAKSMCANCDNEIVVGVMDTGVEYTHEFLSDRIISTDLNFSTSGGENDALDDNGHGTAVSGVIVNSTPDNVKIKPYKVLNSAGSCTYLNIIAAVEYILAHDDKPDIINMSFGGYNFEHISIESELCDRLIDAGITVVIASGNDFLPTEYITPADCEAAITVAAYGNDYKSCIFSNYGEEIDIAAPGEKIYTCYKGNGYASASGTSFSAPFVSAGCAYIKMLNPEATPNEVRENLVANSVYMGSDEDIYFGSGMLSLVNIVTEDTDAKISLAEGEYTETQELSFDNIPDNARVVYTTDLSIPTAKNGIVFSEPIEIKNDVQINYALIDDNGYVSKIKSANYAIQYFGVDSDFEIDDNGVITSYLGDRNNIVVPERINGIVPVEIGTDAFSEKPVRNVVLPDTVEKIYFGFRSCEQLRHIKGLGVTSLDCAFRYCYDLRDEIMPNVRRVSGSFEDCYMLREIDFEDSLLIISNFDFKNTSLTHLNLPNVNQRHFGSGRAFFGTTLISFYAPELPTIRSEDFYGCHFLQDLYIPKVTSLGGSCFSGTYMLTEFDASNIESISGGALNFTYFDIFDAPKITSLSDYSSCFEMSHIRVLRLPGLTGELKTKAIDESRIEQIYLDNITSMNAAFKYSYNLRLLSMPKCTNYIDANTYPFAHSERAAPLEILWLPSCKELSYKCINLEMLFAPSLEKLSVEDARIADFILGDKLESISISKIGNNRCRIYAPQNSKAAAYALESSIPLVEQENALELSLLSGAEACFTVSNLTFDFNSIYFADNVEFGYLYDFSKDANLDLSSNKTTLELEKNLDSKQIPIQFKNLLNVTDKADITVRAYMRIDGVTFYSPNVTGKVDLNFDACDTSHARVIFDSVQQGVFSYRCMDCNAVIYKTQNELLALWSYDCVNKRIDNNADTKLYYLDVVTDDVINAKDYAKICRNKYNIYL